MAAGFLAAGFLAVDLVERFAGAFAVVFAAGFLAAAISLAPQINGGTQKLKYEAYPSGTVQGKPLQLTLLAMRDEPRRRLGRASASFLFWIAQCWRDSFSSARLARTLSAVVF